MAAQLRACIQMACWDASADHACRDICQSQGLTDLSQHDHMELLASKLCDLWLSTACLMQLCTSPENGRDNLHLSKVCGAMSCLHTFKTASQKLLMLIALYFLAFFRVCHVARACWQQHGSKEATTSRTLVCGITLHFQKHAIAIWCMCW